MDLIHSNKHLVFGIINHDGNVAPHPPIQRALKLVVKTIEKLGHKTVEWKPPSHKRGIDICVSTSIPAYVLLSY